MRILVIGAGAAGLMAAITAAKSGAQVDVFEHGDQPAKKILSTGNGHCNLGNTDLALSNYYSSSCSKEAFLSYVFQQFGTLDTLHFFDSMGMLIRNKNGYLYPYSDQASTVRDLLLQECSMCGVQIHTNVQISKLEQTDHAFSVCFHVGTKEEMQSFDRVIVATGGKAAPKTGSDGSFNNQIQSFGHTINKQFPALMALRCSNPICKQLAGVRVNGRVHLKNKETNRVLSSEQGEIQFTDYGISGICVFQLSRLAAKEIKQTYEVSLSLDFFPDYSDVEWNDYWQNRLKTIHKSTVREFFTGLLPDKLTDSLLHLCQIPAELSMEDALTEQMKSQLTKFFQMCRDFHLTANSFNSFDYAQATAGGVPLEEVSLQLESNIIKGLYFAGEILDIDGKCGGYNLQFAWSTGYIAGREASKF